MVFHRERIFLRIVTEQNITYENNPCSKTKP